MERDSTIRERVEYALRVGKPLRPAYSELRAALWALVALGALCLAADLLQLYLTLRR